MKCHAPYKGSCLPFTVCACYYLEMALNVSARSRAVMYIRKGGKEHEGMGNIMLREVMNFPVEILAEIAPIAS